MTSEVQPSAEIDRVADLPPLEEAALLNLRAWAPDPDSYGWHVNEPEVLWGSDMTLGQFRSALTRLRRKGLVECVEWHPGQGNGAPREWLWFLTERGRDLSTTPEAPDCPHGYEAPLNCGLCAGVDG